MPVSQDQHVHRGESDSEKESVGDEPKIRKSARRRSVQHALIMKIQTTLPIGSACWPCHRHCGALPRPNSFSVPDATAHQFDRIADRSDLPTMAHRPSLELAGKPLTEPLFSPGPHRILRAQNEPTCKRHNCACGAECSEMSGSARTASRDQFYADRPFDELMHCDRV